ncbi:carboxyl-terminal processing protease [Chryseobacterium sp. H1D6B]|uniref:S41 family peptidase n=1 Tax=Chryseobacterium sp. H1D6B TaxID=2940588 RepID=UPI0015CBE966|nr:S41 family peptidase [Chryseobacterium sp. H1D6B]MDH6250807.1 carboxyl-terminal processing protease [Chryseobacterium sp. H1D6B]
MKERLFMFFAIFCVFNLSQAQNQVNFKNDSVKNYIDKTFLLIHDNALNKDKINWSSLQAEIYEKTKDADHIADALPVYPYVFEKIEDHHGWLSYKKKNYRWNKNTQKLENKAVNNAVKKYEKVYAVVLHKNIGYLRIPGNNDFGAKKMDSLTNNIVEEIDKINSNKIKGWIIDLRVNTGGNMYPMIAGISDIIGDNEKIGGFVNSNNQSEGEWFLKNGTIYIDANQVLNRRKLKIPIKKGLPAAVLISGYTASSGEMTAIAFVGRNKTRLFGEESGGYTTTNQGFEIDKNSGLNLAVGYAADRKGKVYNENVKPDIEIVGGDNFEDLAKDEKVRRSIKWIGEEAVKH